MQKILLLLIVSTFLSCLNENELNLNKYDNFVISPEVNLPFVQINLSDKFYNEIYDDRTKTEERIDMEADLFKDNDVSKSVDTIKFNFTTINGNPIKFKEVLIEFLDETDSTIDSLILDNIEAGALKSDGSLDYPSKKESSYIFDSTQITNIMFTRKIRVIISWDGNSSYPKPDPSFYFDMNSDVILKTNIEIN